MSMRRGLLSGLAIAVALAQAVPAMGAGPAIIGSNATSAGRVEEPSTKSPELGPMTNSEMQGYGCIATGGVSLGLAALTGTNESVLLFGGSIAPTTTAGAAIAVTGMIFASFCAVGALVTPAAVRLWRYYYEGARPVSAP